MNDITLVADYEKNLFGKFHDKSLVVRVQGLNNVDDVFFTVKQENSLLCMAVFENQPLSAVKLNEIHRSLPIALYVTEFGSFKKVISFIRLLREFNITVFLPGEDPNTYSALRILSSLGVFSGFYFTDPHRPKPWEEINDLMHYAVYTKTNHAPIEPFEYVVSRYNPREAVCFTTPFFDNARRFLHMDSEENIAVTRERLMEKNFIARGMETLDTVTDTETYQIYLRQWQKGFLDNNRCAYCEAWRVCQGAFFSECESQPGCRQFFTDLMEAVTFVFKEGRAENRWQF
jgi:hypothetical protein